MSTAPPPGDDARPVPSPLAGAVARGTDDVEFARVLGFSDNVLAFALTLVVANLVVSVGARGGSLEGAALAREASVFGVTFLLVGLLWLRHFTLFRALQRMGENMLVLNLLFLGAVAVSPVLVRVSLDYPGGPTFALYAADLAVAMTLMGAMVLRARRARLARPGSWILSSRLSTPLLFLGPAILLASIPVGFLDVHVAEVIVLVAALVSLAWRHGRRGSTRPEESR